MFKKHKVVMLPTEKESYIYFIKDKNRIKFDKYSNPAQIPNSNNVINQHLYILSDEEIKEGDWYLKVSSGIIDNIKINSKRAESLGYLKIIASTDKLLGLPRPSDSFIKKYCELGGIHEVMVECNHVQRRDDETNEVYYQYEKDGRTPVLKLKIAADNTITIKKLKNNWNTPEIQSMFHKFTQELKGRFSDDSVRMAIQYFSNKWTEENL